MTKEKVEDILVDSSMLERSDSVSAPMQSVVKLRWKIATRKLREKQCKSAQVPGAFHVRKNTDIKDFRGPGEATWSNLLKKLHYEKQLMLKNSNSLWESSKDHSVSNSATTGEINIIQLKEKSPSASHIITELCDGASKTDNDRSRRPNCAITGVSSASKFLYPKFKCSESDQICYKGGDYLCFTLQSFLSHPHFQTYRPGGGIKLSARKLLYKGHCEKTRMECHSGPSVTKI